MGIGFRTKQYMKMFIQKLYLPRVYKKAVKKTEVDPQKIIMADMHSNRLPYSMQAMYKVLVKKGYKPELFCRDIDSMSRRKGLKYMKRFMREYAAAGHVFICSYFLPVSSCKKREETKVIQLWHSGGLMKKMGYDTEDDIPKYYKGVVTKNYDLVTVSAPVCAPVWESALKLPEGTAKPLGLARTDRYFNGAWNNKCRTEFYRAYPEALGKKIVLYAPSFSGNAADPDCVGINSGIREVFEGLGKEYFLVTRLHPHLRKKYEEYFDENCDSLPTEKILPVTDILITDYSSVLFDYCVYKRPFVLFCPDLQSYDTERGFYVDINTFPCEVTYTADNLRRVFVEKSFNRFSKQELEDFYRYYMGACDGHSIDRILREAGVR